MVMRLLEAGGVPVVSDGIRRADAGNPHGYFEDERVKSLDKSGDKSWLRDARGKAIKIISFLLRELPDTNNYDVIFVRRDMREVLASQDALLKALGNDDTGDANHERMAAGFRDHLAGVDRFLVERPGFRVLYLEHGDLIRRSLEQAQRIAHFVDRPLDVVAMAATVDPALHHHGR